jgi:hypothetical protein
VLETNGITFAPHPMLVETDRDRYAVGQIVDFYRRQNTDLAAYFRAAWRFKHRAALGKGAASLTALAAEERLSPKYLATLWRTLEGPRETVGPIAKLQGLWRKLPGPRNDEAVKQGCAGMRAFVVNLRKKLEPSFAPLAVKGIAATAQPFAMWRNRQYAGARLRCDRGALQIDGQLVARHAAAAKPAAEDEQADEEEAPVARPSKPASADPDLLVAAADRARHEAAFDRFCATFPDTFYVAERGRTYGDTSKDRGRLLSAGFHNLMGYFRDDQPLYQLLLDDKQQAELDRR